MEKQLRPVSQRREAEMRTFFEPRNWSGGSLNKRFLAVQPYVAGRSVLDVGFVTGHRRPDWMHDRIRAVATEAVGVDIDRASVEEVRERGIDGIVADIGDLDLERTFDVVHAGELIEHLDDFSSFLGSVRRHLHPDGRLVLTTPNPFAIANFMYRLRGTPRVNRDHTCWFCEDTVTHLLQRFGFSVDVVSYVPHDTPGRLRSLATRAVRWPLPPRLSWDTMLVVARVDDLGA